MEVYKHQTEIDDKQNKISELIKNLTSITTKYKGKTQKVHL